MIVEPVSRKHWLKWIWWSFARWTLRRWNRLLGKREVFYTMEIGATRMSDDVVQIVSDDDERPTRDTKL